MKDQKIDVIPRKIKAVSFKEMIKDVHDRNVQAIEYVKTTGLCFACKKNPVIENSIRCQECIDETEKILKELRGTSGFVEIK